jgi:hypothetical protein
MIEPAQNADATQLPAVPTELALDKQSLMFCVCSGSSSTVSSNTVSLMFCCIVISSFRFLVDVAVRNHTASKRQRGKKGVR